MHKGLVGLIALPLVWLGVFQASGDVTDKPESFDPAAYREVLVPYEELDLLLREDTRRVLLERAEFLSLLKRAQQTAEEQPPTAALFTGAHYRIEVGEHLARIEGTLSADLLSAGWHMLPFPVRGCYLEQITINGQGVPMGQGDDRGRVLFVEGPGRREIAVRASVPVQTDAARQTISLALPMPAPARMQLKAHGDVDLWSGADVLRRVYDAASDTTRFELLPTAGDLSLVLTLNSKLRRQERAVAVRSVLISEITPSHELLTGRYSLEVMHQAADRFRFRLPAGFEVAAVESPKLAEWRVEEEAGDRTLIVSLQEETLDVVSVTINAFRSGPPPAQWSLSRFEPLDAASHVAVLGLLLDARLQLAASDPDRLVPLDLSVLDQALSGEPASSRRRSVLAFFAPAPDFTLAAEFAEPADQLDIVSNLLLLLRDEGLEGRGGFVVTPTGASCAELAFRLPLDWHLESATDDEGQALAFELFPDHEGVRVLLRFQEPIPAGAERGVAIVARHVPVGWYDPWREREMEFPLFAVESATREVGAIAIEADDDIEVRATVIEGLVPLDENEKARFGLADVAAALAYRFDHPGYRAGLVLTRSTPRLNAETFAFFQVGTDHIEARYEFIYYVERARARQVSLWLPDAVPATLSIRGVGETEVKEYTAEPYADGTHWTITLAEAATGQIHLAMDTTMACTAADKEALRPPMPRAMDVDYQSGFIAVEGSPDLDIRLIDHPRAVDVGELIEAEYRPGRRLLGAFAFIGAQAGIELQVTRRTHHPLPATLAMRGRLHTVLSANRVWQGRAEFELQARPGFLQVDLPVGAELWSAIINGRPALPQRIGDRLVLDLHGEVEGATRLELVYAGTLDPWGFLGDASLQAPVLRVLDREAAAGSAVPVLDFQWVLTLPPGFEVADTRGTMERLDRRPSPVAAVQAGQGVYRAAGTINPRYGLLSGMLLGVQRSALRARQATVSVYMKEHMEVDADFERLEYDFDFDLADGLMEDVVLMESPLRRAPRPSAPAVRADRRAEPVEQHRYEGLRSLAIALAATGDPVVFRGLDERPDLHVTVINQRRHDALAAGVALAVLLGGLLLVGRSWAVRSRYLALVLATSTLLPVVPALLIWTPVFNAAFYAACGLVPLYWLAAFIRRIRPGCARLVHGCYGRLVPLLLATLAVGIPKDGMAGERQPVAVPDHVIVAPYQSDPHEKTSQVLVPYGLFERLLRWDPPVVLPAEMPRPYALAGSHLFARLGADAEDQLQLTGWLDIEVFHDDPVAIPLRLRGAVITQAHIAGDPARLTVLNIARPAPHDALPDHIVSRRERWFIPGTHLLLHGRGRYRVDLELSAPVSRDGGWRRVAAFLPVAPANALVLEIADAATELRFGPDEQRLLFTTDDADEQQTLALPPTGQLELQWRPQAGVGQADPSLFAESTGVLDVLVDRLGLTWRVQFQFRHGEYYRFALRPPEGFAVEAVVGPNVRGWEIGETDRLLRVELLQPARQSETLTVRLRRPGWVVLDEEQELPFPVLRTPEAVRESGRLVLRRSPRLDVRAETLEGVRRIDRVADAELDQLGLQAVENAFGSQVFQSFAFTALPVQVRVQATPRTARLQTSVQALLRVAEWERRLECRVELRVTGGPLHRVSIRLPAELDIQEVVSEVPVEWSVAPLDHQQLTVFFASGVEGRMPVIFSGRLGEPGAEERVALPHIEVLAADEQDGVFAVLADPGIDLRPVELDGVETVLLQRVHDWLAPAQRALARLALAWRQPGYGGWIEPVAIAPDVQASTITHVRVTDRAVEETSLIDLEIHNSGVRRVAFALPADMADAVIRVPLLRERTVEPLPDTGEVLVTLTLQDEVMQQLRILVTHARLLEDGEQSVRLPRLVDWPVNRRLVVLESAGRDEVEVVAVQGLEPLSRQWRDWDLLVPLLRGGQTVAYAAPTGALRPSLQFQPRQRDTVQTAGAGIGLAETDLFVDAAGAYRMRQVYHVNNRTEQFLEVRLPAGARLWGLSVAGDPVKPVAAATNQVVRIPLVKTAAGDLDYPVELMLGGRMDPPRAGCIVEFPLIRTVNIASEQSQVTLRLPRTHRWFAFDGTLRRLADDDQLMAGKIAYQAGLAKRLVHTLEAGNPFEQARARSNLAQLRDQVAYSQRRASPPLRQEMVGVEAVIAAGERAAEEVVVPDDDALLFIERSFDDQRNFYNRNAVLNLEDNWKRPGAPMDAVPDTFNVDWFKSDTPPPAERLEPAPAPVPPEPQQRVVDQQRFWQDNVQLVEPRAQRAAPVASRARGQAEATQRFAEELQESRQAGVRSVAGRVAGLDMPHDQVPAAIAPEADLTGLALPELVDDPGRWAIYRFATPRGEVALSARSVPEQVVEELRRLVAALLVLLLLLLVLRRMPGGATRPARRRAISTIMIVAASLGLLFGVFPLAAIVLLVVGIVTSLKKASGKSPNEQLP